MIELRNITKKYKRNILYEKVNLKINDTGIYSFIGDNGSGKTTLLNIIAKFIKPNKGKVKSKNMTFAFITQSVHLINHLTIKDHFAMFGIENKVLKKVRLYNKLNNYPYQLSKGQKQRIMNILAIYSYSNILLADEPTSHLDDKNSMIIVKEIVKISKSKAVLLVSHDMDLVNKYSDKIYKIENQEINLKRENEREKIKRIKKKKVKNFKYIKKSIFFYKKINFLFITMMFFIFILILLSANLNVGFNKLMNDSVNSSLDYNKFYLKQCDDVDDTLIKKCFNLKTEKIELLKKYKQNVSLNYDAFLNYLYDSDKFNVISKQTPILKEGKYPTSYNEIIANNKYNIGDEILLTSSKVITSDKIDIYNKELKLKVVGISENNMFLKKDNYYLDYNLIDEYLKNEILINNKISLHDYFYNNDFNDYKYVLYFDEIDINILNENNIKYMSASYDYYKNLEVILKEIRKCVLYLILIVIPVCFYYVVRLLIKKVAYKEEEISFFKAMGIKDKKIKKIIYKENRVLIFLSFIISFFIVYVIVCKILKISEIDYFYNFLIYLIVLLLVKITNNFIVSKRKRIC